MPGQEFTSTSAIAVSYDVALAMAERRASQRFLLRVRELLDERNLNQKDLAGGYSEGWISNILKERRSLKRLDDAERIADALQVPLAELLRRPDDLVYELDNLEGRLIDAFRQLTPDEQRAFLTMITLRQRPAPHATGRVGQTRRLTEDLRAELNTVPKLRTSPGGSAVRSQTDSGVDAIRRLLLPRFTRAEVDDFVRAHRLKTDRASTKQGTGTTGPRRKTPGSDD